MKNINDKYQVESTTRYEMFSFTSKNRPVNFKRVKTFCKSILKENLLRENPIIVNEKMQILDGQNRFLAAKELGIPVYYLITTSMKEESIPNMNNNHEKWKLLDLLQVYRNSGFKEYEDVYLFMTKYGFGPTVSIAILSESSNLKEFKNGTFVIKNYERAVAFANHIMDFKPYFDGYLHQNFVAAMIYIWKLPEYKPHIMMQRMKHCSRKLVRCPDKKTYIFLLEEIYNHMSQNKIRFL